MKLDRLVASNRLLISTALTPDLTALTPDPEMKIVHERLFFGHAVGVKKNVRACKEECKGYRARIGGTLLAAPSRCRLSRLSFSVHLL